MTVAEPVVRSLPATRVAARTFRASGPDDVPGRVGPAFDGAWDAFQAAGVTPGVPIAWYAMGPDGMDCWAGFESDREVAGLDLVDLPEVPEAVVVTYLGGPDGIMSAWDASFTWLQANGASPSAPGREVYVSGEPGQEDSWVTEIQQPFSRS